MSQDFVVCSMVAHPPHPVFILPKEVTASGNTISTSPDMAARHHDGNNNRGGILSLLLGVIMLVKPTLVPAQASQPQGPVNEPQKIEAPQKDTAKSSKTQDVAVVSESPYLRAVREFGDNVLKYGRDTYGPKYTPLFVDGLNIHTHEPVKWISPKGNVLEITKPVATKEWILSNFASQQTLLRTLDGLSKVTGDPKYRDAAMQAVKYAFENLRTPNGLFYWGHVAAYDALGDEVWSDKNMHTLKVNYPYYELMWQVNPEETRRFIEAYWSAHIIDWSNLDFNRAAADLSTLGALETPWGHEYKGGPTFFRSKVGWAAGFFHTGTSLAHAATTLYQLSGHEQPLIWSKRIIQRFVDTRHPNTGISAHRYNRPQRVFVGGGMEEHFSDPHTGVFPFKPFVFPFVAVREYSYSEDIKIHQWLSVLLMGYTLGEQGKEFTQWAREELTAWGKASYRAKGNVFMPILTDGTSIEGIVLTGDCEGAPKGSIAEPLVADAGYLWLYATAYKTTGDAFMWQMTRDIAQGNGFGDIGEVPGQTPALNRDTTNADAYSLLGLLELYNRTTQQEFLGMAQRIADNIMATKFHNGFFVPSNAHIYARFDCFEPLAFLHLIAVLESHQEVVPRVWPSSPIFSVPYRYKEGSTDRMVIYTLTDSPEPSLSLQEAAAIGDVGLVRTLIENGTDVDSVEDGYFKTALHRAAISGHKDVVELLLTKGADANRKDEGGRTPLEYVMDDTIQNHNNDVSLMKLLLSAGADVNIKDQQGRTPLHQAVLNNHKEIVELLLAHDADMNIKDQRGWTPLDYARLGKFKDIIELFSVKVTSLHGALQLGDLARVKALLEQGVDVNAKDENGRTPLLLAARNNDVNTAKLLISAGADVNAKENRGYTPLYYVFWFGNKDLTTLLISKGAEVNVEPQKDYPLIYYAVWNEDLDTVKLLVAKGAKFDVKILEDRTAFHYAVGQGSRDIAEFFVSKGIDASTFHVAAGMGDLARVKNHIEQGADVNTQDELGWTPLYWAASLGQTEVAKLLIDKGADVRTAATDGGIALHQAAQAGDNELVELLLSKGADVQAKTKRGDTPLHSAAGYGHREVAEFLIAKGAEIDAKGMGGRTPLHRAALGGHKDVVEILITNGADVAVKDSRGRTPLDLAKLRKHAEIVEILTKAAEKQRTD